MRWRPIGDECDDAHAGVILVNLGNAVLRFKLEFAGSLANFNFVDMAEGGE